MVNDQDLSEEYILDLLKQDAKKVSSSYNRSGMYDVLPKRPVGAAPKPNTRFLKNLVRSTDNHNAALKQKELSDAGKRLRAMAKEREEQAKNERLRTQRSKDDKEGGRDFERKRKRVRRDDGYEHEQHRRRSVDRSPDGRYNEHRKRSQRYRSPEPGRRLRESHDNGNMPSSRHSDDSGSEVSPRRHRGQYRRSSRSKGDGHRHKDKHRSISTDSEPNYRARRRDTSPEKLRSRSHKSHRSRSASESRSRSRERSKQHRRTKDRHREDERRRRRKDSVTPEGSDSDTRFARRKRDHREEKSKGNPQEEDSRSASDSEREDKSKKASPLPLRQQSEHDNKIDNDDDDPLSSFLGPKPPSKEAPPLPRGRGTTSFTSGIDSRFSSTYDPTLDITPEHITTAEDEDWDLALEALRDRQKFRQAGADRLLAAGFTKEEVERMEKGGEKSEADVRWRKQGEAREWDRGKMIDENGYVSVDGDKFGRLT